MYKKKHLKSMSLCLEMLNKILQRTHKKPPGYCRFTSFVCWEVLCPHLLTQNIIDVVSQWFLDLFCVLWADLLHDKMDYYNLSQDSILPNRSVTSGRVCAATAGDCLCTRLWRYTPPSPVSARHANGRVPGAPKQADPLFKRLYQ